MATAMSWWKRKNKTVEPEVPDDPIYRGPTPHPQPKPGFAQGGIIDPPPRICTPDKPEYIIPLAQRDRVPTMTGALRTSIDPNKLTNELRWNGDSWDVLTTTRPGM